MTTNVSLPPALEKFARDCVADGRYSNISEVVRSGLRLLQQHEEARHRFEATLRAAEEESDRDGWHSFEEVRIKAQNVIDARNK